MADGTSPPRGYAICTERRSGSVYLSQLLRSTGVLGRPTEWFDAAAMRNIFGIADYPTDPLAQLAAIPKVAATPNGVYGVKIFSGDFDRIRESRWADRLPNLSFVYLRRLDTLAQAISLHKAYQTQQWASFRRPLAKPVYDFAAIDRILRNLNLAHTRWGYYFGRNGMPVLNLFYEHMVEAPANTVAAVAQFIGLQGPVTIDFSQVATEVQRDGVSEAWRRRYIAEARDLGRFD